MSREALCLGNVAGKWDAECLLLHFMESCSESNSFMGLVS